MVAAANLSDRRNPVVLPGMATACPVRIVYGANDLIVTNIVGCSVAAVFNWLRADLNAPRWCVPFINGQRVGRHQPVRPGDMVEFVYPWGFKGGDDLLSPTDLMAWRGITADQYDQLRQRGLPFVRGKDGAILHPRTEVKNWFSVVPPGAPSWITGDEIEDTLRVWQRSYSQLLTPDDALEILVNTRNLLDVLFPLGGDGKEAVQ